MKNKKTSVKALLCEELSSNKLKSIHGGKIFPHDLVTPVISEPYDIDQVEED